MTKLTGTCTAMVVPFREDGSINYSLYEDLCLRQARAGNHIVTPGTTTESPTLTPQEHVDLIKIGVQARDEINEDSKYQPIKMVAGVGSNSTKEAIEYTQESLKLGADMEMSVVPYYNKPCQRGHLEHQRQVAQVGLPIMIYNIPGRSGSGMTAQTILKAFEYDNIVSLKAADGINNDLIEVLAQKPSHVSVFSGDDTLTHPMLALGADGVVSVSSNLIPERVNDYVSTYDGSTQSLEKFQSLFPLFKANMAFGNPTTIKESMYLFKDQLGINEFEPFLRAPLVRVEREDSLKLEQMLSPYF